MAQENDYREEKGDVSTERRCPICNSTMHPTRLSSIWFWECTNEACDNLEQIK